MQSPIRNCSQPLIFRNWVMLSWMGSPFLRGVPLDLDAVKLEGKYQGTTKTGSIREV